MGPEHRILYRYGHIAWVWRVGIAAAIAVTGASTLLGVSSGDWTLFYVAQPLFLPSMLGGWVTATRIELPPGSDSDLRVRNLLGVSRRIARHRLRGAWKRDTVYGSVGQALPAPRLWVWVRGGLPFYLDLLAPQFEHAALQRLIKGRY